MTTKKSPALETAALPQVQQPTPEEFNAQVAAAVAAHLESQKPKIRIVRCKACWRQIPLGFPNSTGVNHQGICFEHCLSNGQALNYSFTVCRRVGVFGVNSGSFIPGAAERLSQHLGLSLDELIDEDAVTDDALRVAWEEIRAKDGISLPRAAKTQDEIEAAERAQLANERSRRIKGLKGKRDSLLKTLEESNARLDDVERELRELEEGPVEV